MQNFKKYKHHIIVIVAVIAIAVVLFVTNLAGPQSEPSRSNAGTGTSQSSQGGEQGGPTASDVEGEEPPNDNEGF